MLHRLGVRLISFDRPGYGESDRLEGRRVADAAADVLAIADAYELEKFAVVGRSGGGPHALACAALLPERTTKAAVLVGLAPHGAEGLDWFDGMAESNVVEFTAAANGYEGIAPHTQGDRRAPSGPIPASLIATLQAELPDPDRRVVADRGIQLDADRELRRGAADVRLRLDRRRAGVLLAVGLRSGHVTVPVLLWHGASDVFSPVSHARWLADKIPSATVVVQAGAAHFGALDVLPDILRWLSPPARDRGPVSAASAAGPGSDHAGAPGRG